jgi:hypothetical protein
MMVFERPAWAARSEIAPYLGLTAKLMFMLAAKRLFWADGKA